MLRSSSLITALLLPFLVSATSSRAYGTCGGNFGPCDPSTYCHTGNCSGDPSSCLGICIPIPTDGSYQPSSDPQAYQQQQQQQPQSGFQFAGQGQGQPQAQPGYQPQGFQPGQQPQQQQQSAPAQGSTALSCVHGFNAQCAPGTVCLADPRNPAITPVAICVPPTKPCGGQANTVCPSGLFCMADPRTSCDPNRGDQACNGICV